MFILVEFLYIWVRKEAFEMKTKKILVEMIEHLDAFESECAIQNTVPNTTDFIAYLNLHHQGESIKKDSIAGDKPIERTHGSESGNHETDISILISLMNRYAKLYLKKAFKQSLIRSSEEFSFLITLMTRESMTKQEMITQQVMEKTSGIEIINRLIRLNLLSQCQDEQDARASRIQITDLGKMEMYKILPAMQQVAKIVTANLSELEKGQLAYTLRKLDHFHNDIFLHMKDSGIDEILESKF